jgi:hypothetical protein
MNSLDFPADLLTSIFLPVDRNEIGSNNPQALPMENLQQIIDVFSKMVGIDLMGDPDKIGSYDLSRMVKGLRRAQEIEPTQALFLMLLEEQADQFLRKTSITAYDHLERPDMFQSILSLAKTLRHLLATSGMVEEREYLRENMLKALRQYGAADREDVQKLLSGDLAIAHLWRDALEAMETTLETHQFMQGDPETEKPRYQEYVLGFWTINDAIRLSMSMPAGIAMGLIRDPEAVHSYFVFIIRNGGTLTVVTDRTQWVHPNQRHLARRPDRHLSERMARSWFPYELLEVQYLTDEEGDVVGLNVPRQEGIIPQQQRVIKLKALNKIDAQSIVWTSFMFAYLSARHFRANFKTPTMSFTAEMAELPRLIEASAHRANVPAKIDDYTPLELPVITSHDLTTAYVAAHAGVSESTGHNAWMEERYKDAAQALLVQQISMPSLNRQYLVTDGSIAVAPRKPPHSLGDDAHNPSYIGAFTSMDASAFGSAEQIKKDYVFINRENQAVIINKLAKNEFEQRKDEVIASWLKLVEARKNALIELAYTGEFVVNSDRLTEGDEDFSNSKRGNVDILHVFDLKTEAHEVSSDWSSSTTNFGEPVMKNDSRGRPYRTGYYRCVVTDRPATHVACFSPKDAVDLAAIAGIPVSELPDVLQHWSLKAPYVGNQNLQRLDPLEYEVENPWRKLEFKVRVYLSSFAFPDTSPFSRKNKS